jgi:hypothetical protein
LSDLEEEIAGVRAQLDELRGQQSEEGPQPEE